MKKLLLLLFLVYAQAFAGIPLSSNFTMNASLPIEDRLSTADLTSRDALSSLRRWEGMLVYVVSEEKHYTLKGGITNGDWTELSGGGGGNLVDWVTATAYVIGDTVIESSKIYQAITNHTSGVFATDLTNGEWSALYPNSIEASGGVSDNNIVTFDGATGQLVQGTGVTLTAAGNITGINNFSATGTTTLNTSLTGALKATAGVVGTGTINLASEVSGILPLLNGGTGNTTGTATINANLTGPITSVGNATSIAAQTGTGSTFVVQNTPTLTTPEIGAATGTSLALGGTINANAVLDVQSTTKAAMMPRMTTTQKNAIASPTAGMEVYDTTLNIKQYYNGTQWVANTSIQLDNVYSAEVTVTSGSVAKENKDFIASCTAAAPSVCTFNTGYFTTAPNCKSGNVIGTSVQAAHVYNITSTGFSVEAWNTSTGSSVGSVAVPISCQKTGADYQSADAYIASNGNYGPLVYTPIFTGFGTASSVVCTESRDGSYLEMDCRFTSGTATAVEGRVSLPSGLTVASNITNATVFGNMGISTTSGNSYTVISSAGLGYVAFGLTNSGSGNGLSGANGSAIGSSTNISFKARVPISGWTNSNLIAASLAGTPNFPGSTKVVNSMIAAYGTSTRTGYCTASPCSFLEQIGSNIASVTRSAAGSYCVNTSATYSKLYLESVTGDRTTGSPFTVLASIPSCLNCNQLCFRTLSAATEAGQDSYGNIKLIGEL